MGFMALCLPHYMTTESAPFHYELAELMQDTDKEELCIIGFRNSGKTTFGSLAFPLYCALNQRFQFIILINDTYQQAKINMQNVKHEIENNSHIEREYPGIDVGETWSKTDLILNNGVRLLGRSRGQKIRGMRHREHRPDMVIIDDPESLDDVKTKSSRDDTERWFNSEVVPAIDEGDSQITMIGNLLHKDSLMSRVARRDRFETVKIPITDEDGEPTWQAKYPDQESIDAQKERINDPVAWAREYELEIISSEDQIVSYNDIEYYDPDLLHETNYKGDKLYRPRTATTAVDLAISEKESADFTAIISGYKVTYEDRDRIWVLPSIINKRIQFSETIDLIGSINDDMPPGSDIVVEDVAYQKSAIQELERAGYNVSGIKPVKDKRARLQSIAQHIQSGRVMFPEGECDDLLEQLVGFGVEEHDDMVASLVYLIMHLMDKKVGAMGGRVDKV